MKANPDLARNSLTQLVGISDAESCFTLDTSKPGSTTVTRHFAQGGIRNTISAASERIYDQSRAGDPRVIPAVKTKAKLVHCSPSSPSCSRSSDGLFSPVFPRVDPTGASLSNLDQIAENPDVSDGLRYDRAKEATPRFLRIVPSSSDLSLRRRSDWKTDGDPYGAPQREE